MIMRSVGRGRYSSIWRPLIEMVPPPGFTQTRAIAHLRLPVARFCSVTAMWMSVACLRYLMVWLRSDRELVGLLSYVRMLGAGVDLELGSELPSQAVAGKHAGHGLADELLRILGEQVAGRAGLGAARVAG